MPDDARSQKFVLEADGKTANQSERKRLGIPHGNGTSVILELAPCVCPARSLAQELTWHYVLRDITCRRLGHPSLLEKLATKEQSGTCSRGSTSRRRTRNGRRIRRRSYPAARAQLRIWKAPESCRTQTPDLNDSESLSKADAQSMNAVC